MKTIKDEKTGAFIDQNCIIEIQGRKFESGGAWICQRKDTEKFEGVVYITEERSGENGRFRRYFATNWHGDIKVQAITGSIFYSNFGDRRRPIWFKYADKYFYGMWCSVDFNQAVKVREVKPWS